jgi:hypothetical protein
VHFDTVACYRRSLPVIFLSDFVPRFLHPGDSTAVLIPDDERISGVCYAMMHHGVEPPLIDITHPSFAVDRSEDGS